MKNFKILLYFMAALLLYSVGINTAQAQSAAKVYLPIDDAIAHQSFPDSTFDKNNGNLKALNEPIDGSVAWVISYVKFDISQLKGQVVESVNMSIRASSANKEAMQLELYNSKSEEWTRETLTFANKPAKDKKLGTYTFGAASDRKAFDPTPAFLEKLNQALAEGKETFSMEIRSAEKDTLAYADTWIGGKGNGFSYGPKLEITTTPQNQFLPIDDAIAHQSFPDSTFDKNNGNLKALNEPIDGSVVWVISYVKFDISQLKGQVVESATMSIRASSANKEAMQLELYNSKSEEWTRETLTFANKPAKDKKLGTYTFGAASDRKAFDPTPAFLEKLNQALAEGKQTFSMEIRSAEKDTLAYADTWIGGKGNGFGYGPILEITTSPKNQYLPIDDAIAHQSFPDSTFDKNNGNLKALNEPIDGSVAWVISYVKFDISQLKGQVVESATMSIRASSANKEAMQLELYNSKSEEWTRETLTFANKPAKDKKLGTYTFGAASERKAFDPTPAFLEKLNQALAEGKETFSMEIRSAEKDTLAYADTWIGGKGNGFGYGPILEITTSPKNQFLAIDDAISHQSFPDSTFDKNNGNLKALNEPIDGSVAWVISYVKFNISQLKGQVLESATMSIRASSANKEAMQLELYNSKSDEWTRETLTFANKPAKDKKLGTYTFGAASDRKAFDPTPAFLEKLNQALAEGKETFSMEIRSAGKDTIAYADTWIGGKGNGFSYGPILELQGVPKFGVKNDTLMVMEDVYVAQETPDTNYESVDPDMHLIKEDTKDKEVYLKFDIQDVKPGIGTASLIMLAKRQSPPNPTDKFKLQVFGTDSDEWMESTMTWNNKVPSGEANLVEYTIADSAVHIIKSSKLTAYINDAIEAERKYITLVLKGKSATTYRAAVYSKALEPAQLAIDYSDITKSVVEDSYVLQSLPDSIPDTVTSMRIGKDEANTDTRETYLKFDLRNARAGLVTATLQVKGDQEGSMTKLDNFYIGIHGTENTWDETTLKWNNKPVSGDMLAKYNVTKSAVHQITSTEFTNYVKQAISNKAEYISFAIKGVDETPGSNAWISDKGWVPATLNLDYRQVVASPEFTTKPGDYFPDVTVMINAKTDGSMLYYTIDGSEPTMASMEYTSEGIMLTDSTTIKVRGFMEGMAPSSIVEATYNVAPVGLPVFMPNPSVDYQDQVLVTIDIEPADAYIVYSDDGSDPQTPYPEEGILLSQAALIKARGVSQDGNHLGNILEANYKVVNTTPGVGTGPGGIGYKDNTKSGQPENSLWLKADALDNVADGDKILTLPDMSGNSNNAYNTWVEGDVTGNKIVNTGESQKAPPTYIAAGPNGMPSMHFGIGGTGETVDLRSLIINDADNLDGSAGLSLFVVFKRNEQKTDFAAVFQKRNITAGVDQEAYTLEFNGGSDPHKIQMVYNKDLFLRNEYEFKDDSYYIVNTELNADFQKALFSTNGILEKSSTYSKIVQATEATAIMGGFQGMDIAEVILYRKGLNAAQNAIVSNYLSTKYGIDLTYPGAGANVKLYASTEYTYDMIGIGKKMWIDGTTEHEHTWSSGAGLVLKSNSTLADGNFVLAAHNGLMVTTENNWERHWNVEVVGSSPDVSMGFDFKSVGLEIPADISTYKVYYDDGTGFVDMGINGTKDGNVINFAVPAIQEGIYTIATSKPGAVAAPVFDPPAGTYTEVKEVTITSSTTDAAIFYTIDGSEPTELSTAYSSPISISTSTTLKAVAIKDGEKSTVSSALYDMNVLGLDDLSKISKINLYPNPVRSRDFNIDLNNEIGGKVAIRVLDYTGKTKTILNRDMLPGGITQVINTNGWSNGLYLVEIVQNGTHRTVLKMIKEE